MKGIARSVLALVIGCSAPLLIWVAAGNAFYYNWRQPNLLRKTRPDLACSTDMDCPRGFVCMGGRCVPAE